jgi:hypothetical protein
MQGYTSSPRTAPAITEVAAGTTGGSLKGLAAHRRSASADDAAPAVAAPGAMS